MVEIKSMEKNIGREVKMRVLINSITRTEKDGNRWVDLYASDSTGKAVFKIWGQNFTDELEELLTRIENTVVELCGLVELYNGSISLRVSGPSLKIAEEGSYEEADFYPAIKKEGIQTLSDRYAILIERLRELNSSYTPLVEVVYKKFSKKMAALPGGVKEYSFRGGLLLHSIETAEIASATATSYMAGKSISPYAEELDEGLVIAATLLHDIGKMLSLESVGTTARSSVRGLFIGSSMQTVLSLSCMNNALEEQDRVADLTELFHCIESCDSASDSPVRCMEAAICKSANAISETMGTFSHVWHEQEVGGKEKTVMYSREIGGNIVRRRKEEIG